MPLAVVVAVDGSEMSLGAVDWAADEAERHGLPLRIVHAAGDPSFDGDADEVVSHARDRAVCRAPSVRCSSEVLRADVPAEVLAREGCNAFAIVLGARGLGGLRGLLLGSVSLAVAGRADCPVVVVRGDRNHRGDRLGTLVVGVGHGDDSQTAALFACREACVRDAVLVAVRARRRCVAPGGLPDDRVPAEAFDQVLTVPEQRYPGVQVERRIVDGSARDALLAAATDADLVIVGARRRVGHFGLQLGLASHGLLHHAPCPVAVVPQI